MKKGRRRKTIVECVLKENRDSGRIKCVAWDVGTKWKLFFLVSVTKGGLCTSGEIGKKKSGLWLDCYKLATC